MFLSALVLVANGGLALLGSYFFSRRARLSGDNQRSSESASANQHRDRDPNYFPVRVEAVDDDGQGGLEEGLEMVDALSETAGDTESSTWQAAGLTDTSPVLHLTFADSDAAVEVGDTDQPSQKWS